MTSKILIVDDEKNVISSFKKLLTEDGYEVFTAGNAKKGLSILKDCTIDLLIIDIRMPGMSGLEAFSKFKEIDPKLPVIIMTAYGTTETAIEAMQLGAYDYVIKPFDIPEIKGIIEKAVNAGKLMRAEVEHVPKEGFKGDRIIGSSPEMQQIYKLVGQIAANDVTVLIRGESGTGKELIARLIYHHSNRKDKSFMIINSAAIPETLLESELFGYEKGAFTDAKERRIGKLEQCTGGTIFLDEIGDMPHSIQTKLLRVLENKSFERLGGNKTLSVDVRLITATNKNLETLIKEGKFREDLYYRLNVLTINIPPLRERKEDISQLVEYFLTKYKREIKKDIRRIDTEALKLLQDYEWPGNVRELENVIRKALLLSKGNIILPERILITKGIKPAEGDIKAQLQLLLSLIVEKTFKEQTNSLYADVIEEVEKVLIIEILRQTQGNQSQAATLLGISRPTLKDKIEKLGIKKEINIQEI